MADTTFPCPHCEATLRFRPDLVGKKIRCPNCSNVFAVPDLQAEPTVAFSPLQADDDVPLKPAQASAPAAPPPRTTAEDDEDGEANYDVGKVETSQRCPDCLKPMPNERTVICLSCGFNTLTRSPGMTVRAYAPTPQERLRWLLPGILEVVGIVLMICCYFVYALWLPEYAAEAKKGWWLDMHDTEALRLFMAVGLLNGIFYAGRDAMRRLIFDPTPPEKLKPEEE